MKSGREKPPKRGKELAVAAPMTAMAARNTAITVVRLEVTCGDASGCLSPCVALSAASVTCVSYVSAQSGDSSHRRSTNKRAIAVTNQPWLARACPPEFGSNHGLVWLIFGVPRGRPTSVRSRPYGSGMMALRASSPAGVMQYVRPSGCFSIQPFANIPAIICFPAGCICSGRSPRVGLILCNAVRSVACGMRLGRAGIHFPFAFSPGLQARGIR